MADTWQEYQEEAASVFRHLGFEATTDASIKGARTSHDIDVLVETNHSGFNLRWLVECKHWSRSVSKLHVLALREIVSDTGADRGILLCEVGFQSGALEAANLTNVNLTSLAEVQRTAGGAFYALRLRRLIERLAFCKDAYWGISKEERIRRGLRQGLAEFGYSGNQVITMIEDQLNQALRGAYPIIVSQFEDHIGLPLPSSFAGAEDLVPFLEDVVSTLEGKLAE